MANEYERIEKFEKQLKDVNHFISNPTTYIYDQIEDPNTQEIIECTRAIAIKNIEMLTAKTATVASLKTMMSETQAIIAQPKKVSPIPEQSVVIPEISPERRDLSDIIKFIRYSNLDDEAKKSLESLTHQDIIRIRLYFYKKVLETRKKIRQAITINPSQDLRKLQNELDMYEIIIEFIKELELVEQEEIVVETEIPNVIFAPNNKKTTYFYEDITKYEDDRLKAIKAAIDKIMDGYVLKTSSTRPIKSINNLYEYKHPNGIRIMYATIGRFIVICSLFYKDKQRSSKIQSEYEEALSRFKSCENYITENLNNPDFHIEQAELLGQINSLLENEISLAKKAGE